MYQRSHHPRALGRAKLLVPRGLRGDDCHARRSSCPPLTHCVVGRQCACGNAGLGDGAGSALGFGIGLLAVLAFALMPSKGK
jgi:hypothetical protein